MASTLTWLDFSEAERRRALQVPQLFSLKESRDELGLGVIRDALAEALFPGVSTIQRRVRYFLIVPWIFEATERFTDRRLARTADAERRLIAILREDGDTAGLIGIDAGQSLQQLPSMIYWSGLERWGIRTRRGTRERWARFDHSAYANDEGERIDGMGWWHVNVPAPPAEFPDKASLTLERHEADYLAKRIKTTCSGTLLAWLLDRGANWEHTDFPWDGPWLGQLPGPLERLVEHARSFSEAMHGAALLYNLVLARRAEDEERLEQYTSSLGAWADNGATTAADWPLAQFWELLDTLLLEGVQHHRIPVIDVTAPAPADVSAALELIGSRRHQGLVYLHCWGGCGRTGSVIGCYLRDRGLRPDEAVDRVDLLSRLAQPTRPCPEVHSQVALIQGWRDFD